MLLLTGLLVVLVISLLVVYGAVALSGKPGPRPGAPMNYDNRWPGYPFVPGDRGYNAKVKGSFGTLGPMGWSQRYGGWIPEIPVQAHYA